MAKKKQQVQHHADLGSRIADTEIVQFALLPDEVDAVVALKFDAKEVLDGMCLLLEKGYEVVINQNTFQGGYSVCVRAVWSENPNAGKAMYSNAETPEMAMQVALFKCFTIANGGVWRTQSLAARPTLS